jgi:hypothetical protein
VIAGYLWRGWQIPWQIWLGVMMIVAIIAIMWPLRPINLKKMTHRVDGLLGLRAQLITAFEVSQVNPTQGTTQTDNPVVQQLVRDTVHVTIGLRRQVKPFGRGFWLEVQMLIAVAAILGAMLLFDLIRPEIPNMPPVDLPQAGQEPQADEVIPPDPRLQQPPPQLQALSEANLRSILQILADALRDQAITYAVAEAIDRNDLEGAAESLRRLADQLDDLSGEAHRELADSLQEAADNIGGEAPAITDPLERGSQALGINNLAGAGRALEELAEILEELDETTPQSEQAESGSESNEPGDTESESNEPDEAAEQESGSGDGSGQAGTGDQPPGEEEERLPIDGQPLELESELETEERVLQPSELDAQAGEEQTADSPFTRQPLNAAGNDLGPDPLSYPWEKREIIRQYFTP